MFFISLHQLCNGCDGILIRIKLSNNNNIKRGKTNATFFLVPCNTDATEVKKAVLSTVSGILLTLLIVLIPSGCVVFVYLYKKYENVCFPYLIIRKKVFKISAKGSTSQKLCCS